MQHQRRNGSGSAGGRYYRAHPQVESERKQLERTRLASAAYGFIEVHPEFSQRWHPIYDSSRHTYHLTRGEEADWRAFLRENNWQVGEKGREGRIAQRQTKGRHARPLTHAQEAARARFRSEALGRAPESYRGVYNA